MAPYDGLAGREGAAIGAEPAAAVEFCRRIEGELAFLRRIVRRWHREPANADDLVQDTLLQALANAHLWQPDSNLRGWLFTIMRNQFLAAAGRSKRSEAALDEIALDECDPPAGPTEARLVMRDVDRALRLLPRHQQEAVRHIGIDGKSYEEAAYLMGISVAAVRCHLSRGRERLKAMVDRGDATPPAARRAMMSQGVATAPAASCPVLPAANRRDAADLLSDRAFA